MHDTSTISKRAPRPNRTTLEIPRQVRERLDSEAARSGRNRTAIIMAAVTEYLDRLEGLRRENSQ